MQHAEQYELENEFFTGVLLRVLNAWIHVSSWINVR